MESPVKEVKESIPQDLNSRHQEQHNSQDMEVGHKFIALSSGNATATKMENSNQNTELKCDHKLCQRTVIVRNVPFKMTKRQLWDHFTKFGKIRHARFVSDYNGKKYFGQAEIQYFGGSTALNLVKSPRDKLFYSGRYMKPCFRCVRRRCKDCIRKLNDDDESSQQCHFDKLPDELINYIFSFLAFNERISVEIVCKRWLFVNTKITWLNMRALNLQLGPFTWRNNYLTNQILISILKRCGTTLNEIKLPPFNQRLTDNYLVEIAKYCPKLESADLSRTPISINAIEALIEECKNIHTLKLDHCSGFTEKALSLVLSKSKNIKHLNIGSNLHVTGKTFHLVNDCLETLILDSCFDLTSADFVHLRNSHIRHLSLGYTISINLTSLLTVVKSLKPTLTELQLQCSSHYLRLEPGRFLDVIRNCENLQYLNLRSNSYVNQQVIAVISTTCLQLCHLDVGRTSLSDDDLLSLCDLPHLQSLILNFTAITDRILIELSRSGKLQKVEVQACAIGDNGCLALIKNCPGLQLLDVCSCTIVSDSIVHGAQVFKNPDNPKLIIRVRGTSIRNFINNNCVCVEM